MKCAGGDGARPEDAQLRQELPDVRFRMGIGRCHKEVTNSNKNFFEACSALSFSMLAHSGEPRRNMYRIRKEHR